MASHGGAQLLNQMFFFVSYKETKFVTMCNNCWGNLAMCNTLASLPPIVTQSACDDAMTSNPLARRILIPLAGGFRFHSAVMKQVKVHFDHILASFAFARYAPITSNSKFTCYCPIALSITFTPLISRDHWLLLWMVVIVYEK